MKSFLKGFWYLVKEVGALIAMLGLSVLMIAVVIGVIYSPFWGIGKLIDLATSVESHCEKGLKDYNESRWDRAVEHFENATWVDEDYPMGWVGLGMTKRRAGFFDDDTALIKEAVSDLTKAIAINSEIAEAYVFRGWSYECLDSLDMAIKDYSKAIELNPNDSLNYVWRGFVHYRLGFWDYAIQDFSNAINNGFSGRDVHYYRAWAHYAAGKKVESQNDLRSILELNGWHNDFVVMSVNDQIQNELDWNLVEKDSLTVSEYFDLVPRYDSITNLHRQTRFHELDIQYIDNDEHGVFDCRYGMCDDDSECISDLNYGWSRIAEYTKQIYLEPRPWWAYTNRSYFRIWYELCDYTGAMDDLNKAIELKEDFAEAYEDRGDLRRTLCHYRSSLSDYTKALELKRQQYPNDEDYNPVVDHEWEMKIYLDMASVWKYMDNADMAINAYLNALEHAKYDEQASIHYDLARVKEEIGDFKGAITSLDQKLKVEPRAYIYLQRAELKEKLGDYDGALVDYDNAVMENPNRGFYWLERARYKANSGNMNGALNDVQDALVLIEDTLDYLEERGDFYYEYGLYQLAIQDFNVVSYADSESSEVLCKLGLSKIFGNLDSSRNTNNFGYTIQEGCADLDSIYGWQCSEMDSVFAKYCLGFK